MIRSSKVQCLVSFFVIFVLLFSSFFSLVSTADPAVTGFDKGPGFTNIVPLKKATFINFNKESYIDDYAYLASIPSSVFFNENKQYCSPLMFYQEENAYPDEEKYLFLNDYDGTHYLMEDWMSYCGGRLDKLTAINIAKSEMNYDTRNTFF